MTTDAPQPAQVAEPKQDNSGIPQVDGAGEAAGCWLSLRAFAGWHGNPCEACRETRQLRPRAAAVNPPNPNLPRGSSSAGTACPATAGRGPSPPATWQWAAPSPFTGGGRFARAVAHFACAWLLGRQAGRPSVLTRTPVHRGLWSVPSPLANHPPTQPPFPASHARTPPPAAPFSSSTPTPSRAAGTPTRWASSWRARRATPPTRWTRTGPSSGSPRRRVSAAPRARARVPCRMRLARRRRARARLAGLRQRGGRRALLRSELLLPLRLGRLHVEQQLQAGVKAAARSGRRPAEIGQPCKPR